MIRRSRREEALTRSVSLRFCRRARPVRQFQESSDRWGARRQVSPHPGPLPQGEGGAGPGVALAWPQGDFAAWGWPFPLPGGEGQGENAPTVVALGTLEPSRRSRQRASVLDCGSPLPLLIGRAFSESGGGAPHSKTSRSHTWRFMGREDVAAPPNCYQEGRFNASTPNGACTDRRKVAPSSVTSRPFSDSRTAALLAGAGWGPSPTSIR